MGAELPKTRKQEGPRKECARPPAPLFCEKAESGLSIQNGGAAAQLLPKRPQAESQPLSNTAQEVQKFVINPNGGGEAQTILHTHHGAPKSLLKEEQDRAHIYTLT